MSGNKARLLKYAHLTLILTVIRVLRVVNLFSCDIAIHSPTSLYPPLHFLCAEQPSPFQCNQQLFTRVPNELVFQEGWHTQPIGERVEGTTCHTHHLRGGGGEGDSLKVLVENQST